MARDTVGTVNRSRWWRAARWTGLGTLAVAVALQLVPYSWSHPNPPVRQDAPWPDAESEAIARQSCYACHSNETDWPPYSYVAPMSWLIRWDVERGREELNFSQWDRDQGKADKAAEQVLDRAMALDRYTVIHHDARLATPRSTRWWPPSSPWTTAAEATGREGWPRRARWRRARR
jgi:Haem-binding domain